jgi:hypothetical protein
MKLSTKREKWMAGVLGALCLGLLVNLALRSSGFVRAVAPHSVASRASAASPQNTASSVDGLAQYDPEVRLDVLDDLDSRDLPEIDRNPFQFGLTPEEKKAQEQPATTPTPPPPPAPPPPTVKAMGYSELGGVRKAILCDTAGSDKCADDAETYQVKEGENFANKYKVISITPTLVEIEDESSHQKVELPFPQS